MDKNKKWIAVICAIVVAAAMGLGGYYLGKSAAEQQHQKEKELDMLLSRSDLEGLGEIEGTIYVTGHRSPDSDTVGCAIGYAALLQKLGYDAKPVVLGQINHETEYVLEKAGVEVPPLMENAAGENMVLVDHSEYLQSADGLKDAHIVSVIDHHGVGTVTTGNPLIYDARPIGSAATIVWMRYRNYGIELDQNIAAVMLGSVLSDTQNLKTETTTTADREAVKALSAIAGVDDTDTLFQEMFKASLSYEGMTDEEIFLSDYKEYETSNVNYSIGCMNAYDEEIAKDLAQRMKTTIPSVLPSTGMDMSFAQISIYHDDISITYLVPSDEAAADVLRAAFGDAAVYDGTSFRIEPGFSRKTLVSDIQDVLESYPKE